MSILDASKQNMLLMLLWSWEHVIIFICYWFFADEHITEDSSTQWKQDRQPWWSLLCSDTASQYGTWISWSSWHWSGQYSVRSITSLFSNSVTQLYDWILSKLVYRLTFLRLIDFCKLFSSLFHIKSYSVSLRTRSFQTLVKQSYRCVVFWVTR